VVHRGPAWGRDDGPAAGPVPTWRDALRGRTREAHDALDRALTGPSGRLTGTQDYVRVLRTLHALHAWSEHRLRQWAAVSALAAGLPDDVVLPDRASLYAGDLRALGAEAAAPDAARGQGRRSDAVDEAEGLALLYLLGGSSAGARVLLRGLPADVPRAARRGLTDASGPESSRLWRAVLHLLAGPAQEPLATRAAEEADTLFAWLRERAEERAA
jgi:heme oxygenase